MYFNRFLILILIKISCFCYCAQEGQDDKSIKDFEFVIAINNEDLLKVEKMLKGLDINAKYSIHGSTIDNMTALIIAVKRNKDIKLVKLLLDHGANPNLVDGTGKTALEYACDSDYFKPIVILLLDYGADLNVVYSNKQIFDYLGFELSDLFDIYSKEYLPYRKEQQQKVKNAIEEQLSSNGSYPKKLINLIHEYDDNKLILKFFEFLKFKKEVNEELHKAVKINDLEAVIKLLNEPLIDVNHRNQDGKTPLMIVVNQGMLSTEIEEALIKSKADINLRDNNGCTALIYAAKSGYPRKVKFLLDNNADVDIEDKFGNTALNYAKRVIKEPMGTIMVDIQNPGCKRVADLLNIYMNEYLPSIKSGFATALSNSDVLKVNNLQDIVLEYCGNDVISNIKFSDFLKTRPKGEYI